jgi:hypothetical protein
MLELEELKLSLAIEAEIWGAKCRGGMNTGVDDKSTSECSH